MLLLLLPYTPFTNATSSGFFRQELCKDIYHSNIFIVQKGSILFSGHNRWYHTYSKRLSYGFLTAEEAKIDLDKHLLRKGHTLLTEKQAHHYKLLL